MQLAATATGAGSALADAAGAPPATEDGAGGVDDRAGAGTTPTAGGANAARTTRRMNPASGSAGSNRPPSAAGSRRSGSNETLRSRRRPVLVGQVQQRRQQGLRDVRGDRRRGGGRDRPEPGDDVRRALLRQHRADQAPLARHPVVVVRVAPGPGEPQRLFAVEVLDARGHVAVRRDAAAAVGDPADRQRLRPDVHRHAAERVDQRGQPVHVDGDVVVDRQPQHRRDRRHEQVHAAVGRRPGGGQLEVGAAVLGDVVEQVVAGVRRAPVVEAVAGTAWRPGSPAGTARARCCGAARTAWWRPCGCRRWPR